MRTNNFFKRFLGIALSLTMCMMLIPASVSAEDISSANNEIVCSEAEGDMQTRDMTSRTVTYYINVPSWSLYRTLRVSTGNGYTNTGVAFVYLYRPDGSLVNNDWVMGINDNASWTVWNVSAGQYVCKVVTQQDASSNTTYVDVTF